jgi:CxxC-x17-CxxC domain-containing protein
MQHRRVRRDFERNTKLKHGRKGNMAEDQQLMCSDCGQAFTFTAEDQEFFRERGYSAPKRCKTCRQAKKNEQAGGGGGGYSRGSTQGTSVICAGCGQQTTVPFEPRGDRPVYCQNCFQARKTSGAGGGGNRRGGGGGFGGGRGR